MWTLRWRKNESEGVKTASNVGIEASEKTWTKCQNILYIARIDPFFAMGHHKVNKNAGDG
jgi:hypothetical protein